MIISKDFNFKLLFVFLTGLTIGFLIGFSSPCYAYQYGDSENDFKNPTNTLTEFTSLNSLLNDTSYRPSEEEIKNKISNNKDSRIYLISYYNSGVYMTKNYKSLDLITVPDGVYLKPNINLDTGKVDYLYFTGEPGQVVSVIHHGYILPSNVSITLDSFGKGTLNYSNPDFYIRSIFDITNYHDFSQMLPNFFVQQSFSETGFLDNLFNSVNSFGFYIALMISLFIFIYILDKKLNLGLNMNYKGGVKLWKDF